jgi:hypothetical protein
MSVTELTSDSSEQTTPSVAVTRIYTHFVLEQAADTFSQLRGFVQVRVRADDGEFLAAVARHYVSVAHHAFEVTGGDLQHAVADFVAVGIVDGLEVVEVEHDQRHLAAVAPRA